MSLLERAPARQHFLYSNRIARWAAHLPVLFYRLGLGYLLNYLHIMILTTRGRKSGLPRHTPIEYRRHGSKFYVISAWGERPHWYQNLLADSLVAVRLGGKGFTARASLVTDPGEALRVLYLFRRTAPLVSDTVLTRLTDERSIDLKTLPSLTDRVTIVRLDRRSAVDDSEISTTKTPLKPVCPDLVWLLPVVLLVTTAALLLISFARTRRA